MVRIVITILFSTFLFRCTTTYSVRLLKPSEINLAPIKKIAVVDFQLEGTWYNNKKKPHTIKDVAIEILKKHLGINEKPHYQGYMASEQLISALIRNGHYTLIYRNQLKRITKQHNIPCHGFVDKKHVIKIGKYVDVEAIILGSGGFTVSDIGKWEERKIKDENDQEYIIKMYKAIRKVDLQFSYQIVNVASGEILASRNLSWANYSGSGPSTRYSDFALDSIKAVAIKKIPAWKPIVDRLVSRTTNQIVKQIAPHYVVRRKKIENGKSPQMKIAIKYVKRNLWEDAKQCWERVLKDHSKKARKDHVAALYNLGIYYEIHDNLDKAEQLFDQCFKKSGKDKYLNAKAGIQRRRTELQRLDEQMLD